jgi:hypothetical protein
MAATKQHMQGNTEKRSALGKGKKQEDDKSRDFIGMDNVHSGQGSKNYKNKPQNITKLVSLNTQFFIIVFKYLWRYVVKNCPNNNKALPCI